MVKTNWYITEDREHMSDWHGYGCTKLGTAYRPNGSPINFAGDGEVYLRKLAERGEERWGYDPTGKSDNRTEEEAMITITEYNKRKRAGTL